MHEDLIEKYKEYCRSGESYAVLFVKKYLRAAKNKWIDILDFEVGYHNDIHELEFKNVVCALFDKKIQPKYPPKKMFNSDEEYTLACRAVTWETAHRDISAQRGKNIEGLEYSLRGVTKLTYGYKLVDVKRVKNSSTNFD